MFKVLLVDDEKWVRATIKKLLPIEQLELNLVGEASNGIEALELTHQLVPDIVITDLRMPGLDGIELIRSLKATFPNILTIIISGYSDFTYAQQAIKLEAFDYILKPVNEKDLFDVLSKAKKSLITKRERLSRESMAENEYKKSVEQLRQIFLNDTLTKENLTLDQLKTKFQYFKLPLEVSLKIGLLAFVIDYPINNSIINKEALSSFKNIIDLSMEKYLKVITFINENVENQCVALYNIKKNHSLTSIKAILSAIQKDIWSEYSITFSVGISSQENFADKLSKTYNEAIEALQYKISNGHSSLKCFNEIDRNNKNKFSISESVLDKIVITMKLLEKETITSVIDEIFDEIDYNITPIHVVKSELWNLLVNIVNCLECKTFTVVSLNEYADHSFYHKFKNLNSAPDIKIFTQTIINYICESHLKKAIQNPKTIDVVKEYLASNYNHIITLELISNYVNFSPTYFSELFKKETGQNFIHYLTELRILKAKELLKTTNLKIYEIGEQVGYPDEKYFRKVFKRIVGIKPSEYKIL